MGKTRGEKNAIKFTTTKKGKTQHQVVYEEGEVEI